ncbi:hypothetical protein DPEC_G00308830 [Dallia pectoralis]|uniref:Uncharacterized protein n=1 Tax=Dallia pectoralis TaxID=75939 RepID=A0ACC2FEV1_DALPE|nr:hypothetical protein DPEC_G00308830 [Dallia pectoralis]
MCFLLGWGGGGGWPSGAYSIPRAALPHSSQISSIWAIGGGGGVISAGPRDVTRGPFPHFAAGEDSGRGGEGSTQGAAPTAAPRYSTPPPHPRPQPMHPGSLIKSEVRGTNLCGRMPKNSSAHLPGHAQQPD